MKKQINDLLLKMQTGENCIGETANHLFDLFGIVKSLPTKEEVISEGEKQIIDWLEGNTDCEKKHYRIGFRRSFEYVLRRLK